MVKIIKSHLKNKSGFSLIEVMISLAIFAVFIISFITGEGFNLLDSQRMREELKLKELAEMKMHELTMNPPPFRESLTSATKETKKFEDYPNYQWSLEIIKFEIPDLGKISGQKEIDPIQAKIYSEVSKNMEKLLWQLRLEVTNIETKEIFELDQWLYNKKGKVQFSGI